MTMQPHSKYRIKVAHSFPSSEENYLLKNKRSVLGVSMSNPVFWRSSLNTMLSWMNEHFECSLILVGDYLQRFNEMVANGGREKEATELAVQKGDEFINKLSTYLPLYPSESFEVKRWRPLYEHTMFADYKASIDSLYRSDLRVRESVLKTARHFVTQKKQRINFKVTDEVAVGLSVNYLLEEMAVFSILIDEGWNVVLYPGSQLPLLMEIAKGEMEGLTSSLNKGTYLELKLRKK